MAWNGSNDKNVKAEGKGREGNGRFRYSTSTSNFNYKALAAGLIVVMGGGLAAYFLTMGKEDEPDDLGKIAKPSLIGEVAPKIATNTVEVVQTEPEPQLSERERQLKAIRDKYGNNIPDNLKPVVYYLENPPKRTFHPMKTRASIFKRPSDRAIASLLLVPPGSWMLRCPSYDERFDTEFKESLSEKIEITDEDTEEDVELKRAVMDVREELAKRMRAGEVPSKLINNEFEALYSLGQYRNNLSEQLAKIEDDETLSDTDLNDFVTAANLMLEEKGLPGFEMPNLVIRQIQLEIAAEKRWAAEQAAADKSNNKNKEN